MTDISKQSEEHLNRILDVFSGADGGVGFVTLRRFIMKVEREDTPASKQLLKVFHDFGKLLKVISKL